MPATRCRPERTKGAQGRVTEKRKRGHTDVAPSKKKKCLFPNSGSYKAAATLPEGVARDSAGALKFDDFPEFRPNLTPREVLVRGAFGGCYFNPKGGKQGVKFPYKTTSGVPITHLEFPKEWFEGLEDEKFLSRKYRCEVNKYGVKAGQDQRYWEEKGWIHEQDPRGWFHWYCRFFLGRRTTDDVRQISRWVGVTGKKGRWKRNLLNKILAARASYDDTAISPVVRQTLLHWAYEITEKDLRAHAKAGAPAGPYG
mmetsp:Transcript_6618/g.24573  ORF Transcript_6618/g.24573 Transcript_6618/m.24573 type:complete len:255 (+) Transcript_6618:19-783(+)